MATSTKTQVLSLYRMLLRESEKFPAYNYRTYALRRVKDAFRANSSVEDRQVVGNLMDEGHQTLALIKRQVCIGQMYVTHKSFVEDKLQH